MSGKRGVHGGAQTAGQRTGGGVVRRVDELGRIAVRDPLEIGVRGDSIVLSKPHDSCVFCGRNDGLAEFKGRMVCHECRVDLANVVPSER